MASKTIRGIVFVKGPKKPTLRDDVVSRINKNTKELFEKYAQKMELPEGHFKEFYALVNDLNNYPDHKFRNVFVEDEKLKDKLQKDKPFVVIKLGDPLFKLANHEFYYRGELNNKDQPDGRGVVILPGYFVLAANFKDSIVKGEFFLLDMIR